MPPVPPATPPPPSPPSPPPAPPPPPPPKPTPSSPSLPVKPVPPAAPPPPSPPSASAAPAQDAHISTTAAHTAHRAQISNLVFEPFARRSRRSACQSNIWPAKADCYAASNVRLRRAKVNLIQVIEVRPFLRSLLPSPTGVPDVRFLVRLAALAKAELAPGPVIKFEWEVPCRIQQSRR